jgi:hypothetical protein
MWRTTVRVALLAVVIGCPLFAYVCTFFEFDSIWEQWNSNAGVFFLALLRILSLLVTAVQFIVLAFHITSASLSVRALFPKSNRTAGESQFSLARSLTLSLASDACIHLSYTRVDV